MTTFSTPGAYNRSKKSSLLKMRLVVGLLTTLCPLVCYMSRQNLAIAIVSMVEHTPNPSHHLVVNNSLVAAAAELPDSLNEEALCPAPTNAEGKLEEPAHTYGPRYKWSSSDRNLLFQSFFVSYVVFQIPGARLAEQVGAKWVLAVASLGSAFISLISPWAASLHIYAFAFARLVLGAFQAPLYPACYIIFIHWLPPRERTRAIPSLGAACYVGSIIISSLTGYFSESPALGWQWAFYAPSIACTLWGILWIVFVSSTPRQNKFISLEELEFVEMSNAANKPAQLEETTAAAANKSPSWKRIFTSQGVIAYIITFFASSWVFTITLLLIPSYLNDILQVPPFKNGLINSIIYILYVIMAPVIGTVSSMMIETRTFGLTHLQTRKLFQTIGLLGEGIGFFLIPFLGCQTSLVLGVLYLQIVAYTFHNGGEVQLPAELSMDFAGTIYAIGNCIGSTTGVLVPEMHKWVVRNSYSKLQWNIYFFLSGLFAVMGALVFILFGKNQLEDFSRHNHNDDIESRTDAKPPPAKGIKLKA